MAETKLSTIESTAASTSRDFKTAAKGTIPVTPSSAASFSPKPRTTIWDLSDEVAATVLAELRL